MAEYVELSVEESLGEIENLEHANLFSRDEARQIQKNREQLFYRLQKAVKTKEDYLEYIKFEMNLLSKIEQKRVETNNKSKKDEIDFKIMDRVKRTYTTALQRYQSDLKLWEDFFDFCRKVKFWGSGSKMLQQFIQVHGHREETWKFAAEWEIESKNSDKARPWLLKGIERHPASSVLFTALIVLELDCAQIAFKERVRKQRNREERDVDKEKKQLIRGKCAEIAYMNAKKVISDMNFFINIFRKISSYPSAKSLRDQMLNDLMKNYSAFPVAWDLKARVPMEDANVPPVTEFDVESGMQIHKASIKERIKEAISIYETAVKVVPTIEMWTHYLDFLVEINKDESIFRRICWKKGMEGALEVGMVTEKHFILYIESLRKTGMKNKKVLDLLKKGTEKHPYSPQLWYELIQHYLSRHDEFSGLTCFRKANDNLRRLPAAEVLPMWNMVIQYLMTTTPDRVEQTFMDGIRCRTDLSQLLKSKYLVWKVQMQGIGEARKLLEIYEIVNPPCQQFYQQLAKLETIQPDPCIKSIRNCYETLVRHFGNDPNVWIDYIAFELKMGDVGFVAKVHRRAVKTLPSDQLDPFLLRYSISDINGLTHTELIID